MFQTLRSVYQYRSLLFNLVVLDQKIRYKNTLLGFLWSFLNPLLLMLVFLVVFGHIGRFSATIPDYPLFLLTGMLPWFFFTGALQLTTGSMRSHASLLGKIHFPKQIIPIAAVLTNLINYVYSLLILLVFYYFSDAGFSMQLLYVPLLIVLQTIMTIGTAYILSAFSAFYQDIAYLLNIGLTIGFYLTPIFYPMQMVPDRLLTVFYFNPMVHFITAYHRVLLYHKAPGLKTLLFIVCYTFFIYLAGQVVFKRLQGRIPEVL